MSLVVRLKPADKLAAEQIKKLPQHLRWAKKLSGQDLAALKEKEKKEYKQATTALPKSTRVKLSAALEALRFVDFEDLAVELMRCYRSNSKTSFLDLEIQNYYNQDKSAKSPEFRNIRRLSAVLKKSRAPITLERILKSHRIAMRGVKDIDPKDIGRLREHAVYGDESKNGLSTQELRAIKENIYLSFEADKKPPKNGKTFGLIRYPAPATLKPSALKIIEERDSRLAEKIKASQLLEKEDQDNYDQVRYSQLTRQLIKLLAEERIERYNQAKENLGPLDSAEKILEFVKITALFYRDMISIHPLVDGNGRVIRQTCLYSPLDKAGISRPRLNRPDDDILKTPGRWVKGVHRAIRNTNAIYHDIRMRCQHGLDLGLCPHLIYPNMPPDVMVHQHKFGHKRVEENAAFTPVDAKQFATYMDLKFSQDSQLWQAFQRNPLIVLNALHQKYKEFAKRSQLIYRNHKDLDELVKFELVDQDFARNFGESIAESTKDWEYKMRTWYTDTLIWRGISNAEYVPDTAELLGHFAKLGEYTISQKLLNRWSPKQSHDYLLGQVNREFKRYNQDLLSGRLAQMAQDHADAGELYADSYGLSTSTRLVIARAFAMGALVLDQDFSAYWKLQDLLKSRVVIGALRARKDVRLPRLGRTFPDDFRYHYFRQQETMAIGGIDPDSVVSVLMYGPKAEVIRSLVRDPKKPDFILDLDPNEDAASIISGKIAPRNIRAKYKLSE